MKRKKVQAWVDEDFDRVIRTIKGKRLVNYGEDISLGDITKEIVNNPKFNDVVQDLCTKSRNVEKKGRARITFRFDKGYI